jgi:hypothetical protein
MPSCIWFLTKGPRGSAYDLACALLSTFGFSRDHAIDNTLYPAEEIP